MGYDCHMPSNSLWRDADFMKLWSAQTVSRLGSALSGLALPLIAAGALGAGPAEMGLLSAAGSLPALLVGLPAGVWADRARRRPLLVAADAGRALLLASLPAAAALGALGLAQLYLVTFLSGVLGVLHDVAARSYLPAVVGRERLVQGNSQLELSGSLSAVAGPSLAGLVIQAITAPLAVALDALSFAASAACIGLIRRAEAAPAAARAPALAQMREGLGLVLRHPLLRALAGCLATSNFTSNVFYALYILFGTRELGLDAAALGLVYGLGAAGALLAALVAPALSARLGPGRALLAGALLGSLEVLPAALATPQNGAALLVLSSLLGNFGWVLYNVNAVSLRQAVTPPQLLGRMNASMSFLMAGMLPLGALAGGALGEAVGLRGAVALAAAGSLFSVLWLLFSPARRLKGLPGALAEEF